MSCVWTHLVVCVHVLSCVHACTHLVVCIHIWSCVHVCTHLVVCARVYTHFLALCVERLRYKAAVSTPSAQTLFLNVVSTKRNQVSWRSSWFQDWSKAKTRCGGWGWGHRGFKGMDVFKDEGTCWEDREASLTSRSPRVKTSVIHMECRCSSNDQLFTL